MLKGTVPLTTAFGQKKVEISKQFAVLEQIIQDGRLQWIKVGEALCAIRDNKFYKERGYGTFAEYCEKRWDFGKSHAYRLIEGSMEALKMPETERPKTEGSMRKLLKSQQKMSPNGDISKRSARKQPALIEAEIVLPEPDPLLKLADQLYARGRINPHWLKAFIEWASREHL